MSKQVIKAKVLIGLAIIGMLFLSASTVSAATFNDLRLNGPFKQVYTDALIDMIEKTNEVVEEGEQTLITINSPGGYVYTLDQVVEAIEDSEVPVNTHIYGYAYSCGAMLFLEGKKRVMKEGSSIMFHYASIAGYNSHELYRLIGGHGVNPMELVWAIFTFGSMEDMKSAAEELAELDRTFKTTLDRVIGKDAADKVLRGGYDVYLNAREALAAGIATDLY